LILNAARILKSSADVKSVINSPVKILELPDEVYQAIQEFLQENL